MSDAAALVGRELRRETNRRFLQRMPEFRLDGDTPREFHDLLAKLDRVEQRCR